jgi:hypothetical protein
MEKRSPADEQRLAFTAEEDAKCLKMLQLMAEGMKPAKQVVTVPGSLTREDLANACRLAQESPAERMVDYVREKQAKEAHEALREAILGAPTRPFLVRELPNEELVEAVRQKQREGSFLFSAGLLPVKPLGETDGKT